MKDASSSVLNATAVCNNEYVPLLLKSTSLVIESDNWLSRLCTSYNVLAIELPIWLIELSKSATLYPISSYISETEFIYP